MSITDLDRPLGGVATNNPRLLSRDELVHDFVARQPLLDRMITDLRLAGDGVPQHRLLLGLRGMGKTTFLCRLRFAIEDDPTLGRDWMPLTFPEEQYNISALSDLWLNCLDAATDALEQRGDTDTVSALDAAIDGFDRLKEDERARQSLALLMRAAEMLQCRFVLLLDNFDLILNRLQSAHWTIRELLSVDSRLWVVAASSRAIEATFQYEAAFYDFFQFHELAGFSQEQMSEMLIRLAERNSTPHVTTVVRTHPERIGTLQILSGGNPRTIAMLYTILARDADGDVRTDLEQLLDRCTPLYKARFEALSAQAQKIVDAMALHWHPVSAGDLAGLTRLDNRVVSVNLDRLRKQGLVEKVAYVSLQDASRRRQRRAGYQLAERFFNIWYLMRASRRGRRRLLWLIEFLRLFLTPADLRRRATRHLSHTPNERSRAEYSLAYADVIDEPALRGALQHDGIHTLAQLLARVDRWPEAREAAKQFIQTTDEDYLSRTWSDIVGFFKDAVQHGHARDAVALLEESGAGERWAPLREALLSLATGSSDSLLAVAPEVRIPAEALLDQLR